MSASNNLDKLRAALGHHQDPRIGEALRELQTEIAQLERYRAKGMLAEAEQARAEVYREQINFVTSRLIQQRRRLRELETIVADHAAHYQPKLERLGKQLANCHQAWRELKKQIEG